MPATAHSERAGKVLNMPGLKETLVADVVVIGGGIAGTAAALRAAERGASVVLLEAQQIGWGASSRNAGHVAAATKFSPAEVLRLYGPVYGPRLNEAAEDGPDLVFDLVKKHCFEASVDRSGILIAAHTPEALTKLERRAEYLAREHKPVEILDRAKAQKAIGSDLYLGAYHDRRGGTINPLAFVRGLARAAIDKGARVFEGTKAVGIEAEGPHWKVVTPDGTVNAPRVILCTNAYSDDLWPKLRKTIVPARAFQLATSVLPPEIIRDILPGRQALTDTRRLLSGLRKTQDGRLHFGGLGALSGSETDPDIRASRRRLQEIFPQLETFDIDFVWSGFMAMSTKNAWQLHQLAPGVTAAIGCNGRGVAIATFLGRELAEHGTGKPADQLVLPFTPVRPLVGHRFHPPVVEALARLYNFRDQLELRRLKRITRSG